MRRTGESGASAADSESCSSSTSPDRDLGRLIIVSGPSGVGKTSVVEAILDRIDIGFSVSATTRDPRIGEVDGVDYDFVSDDAFDELIHGGGFLEWAPYGGHRYGTPGAPVEASLAAGRDMLLDVENEGARQVRRSHPDALLIFVAPPSLEELERRLRRRGDTSDSAIAARLEVAAAQIQQAPLVYDHVVVNEALDDAIAAITSIILEPPRPASSADAPSSLPGTSTKETPR